MKCQATDVDPARVKRVECLHSTFEFLLRVTLTFLRLFPPGISQDGTDTCDLGVV